MDICDRKYEVSSIKNANSSIKFEGINLQKCLIACKKGINIVIRFQYSEIGWQKNSAFHRQLKKKKSQPRNNWTTFFLFFIFQNCPKKGVKGDAIYFVNSPKCVWRGFSRRDRWKKDKKSKNIKKSDKFFFKYFEIAPQKRCPGERRLHPQRPQCVFEEDEA